MATSFLSAGVYVREIDFSLYLPNLSTTAVGCVGYATKGPINQPQYISNPVQFSTVFGDPSLDMTGPYAALQFLSMGRQLWYVRVAEAEENQTNIDAGFKYLSRPASVTLKEAVTKAKLNGKKTNVVTFTSSNNHLIFLVDGAAIEIDYPFSLGSSTSVYKSMTDIANDLNRDANFQAYFTATLSATGSLAVERKLAGSNHGFTVYGTALSDVLGYDATPNPPQVWGTGNVAEKAYIVPNIVFPSTLHVADAGTLTFVVDGSNVVVTFPTSDPAGSGSDYTAQQFIDYLNTTSSLNLNFPTSLVASLVSGGVFVSIKTSATAVLDLALGGTGAGGDIGPAVFGKINAAKYIVGSAVPTLSGWDSTNNTLSFKVIDTPANTYDTYSITLTTSTTYASLTALVAEINLRLETATKVGTVGTVDISSTFAASEATTAVKFASTAAQEYVLVDPSSSAFARLFATQPTQKFQSTVSNDVLTVTATSDGSWGNKLTVAVSNVDTTKDTFNLYVYERGYAVERYESLSKDPANARYVVDIISGVSSRILVTNAEAPGATLMPNANATGTATSLTGGLDGTASSTNPSTFIGVNSDVAQTGLQLFRNPEQLDINLIMAPGIASVPVANAMVEICNYRHDCMSLVDPPFGLKPQDIVDWANGTGVYYGEHAALNTSYAALYWPWLQIYDSVNKQTVWTPPSGHISYIYAYTDYNSETWFAPAGLNRGHLSTPIKAEYIPTLGERDLLYQNNINPIATFIRDGINVWGQKTLQRAPTALDRVYVRRIMLYLEKVVATAVRTLVFEPSDKITWIQFINLVEPFLESVKSRRGLIEFKIVCDSTTNTPDVIDRNEMHARIYIRPTKAAEFISIDFVLTDSGTAFSELVF